MKRFEPWLGITLTALFLMGCGGAPRVAVTTTTKDAPSPASSSDQSTAFDPATPTVTSASVTGGPLAFIQGSAVTRDELFALTLEAAGSAVLPEVVLDRMITRRLAERGLKIEPAALEREQQLMLDALSSDREQATRLLNQLKDRRGWGTQRFASLLRRNAGLRALVKDSVQVLDESIKQAYDVEYGQRFEARLILVESAAQAADMVRRAHAGESFIDLAIAHSRDESRAQGGLLPLVSPADPSFPLSIRAALLELQVGQISQPVAMDEGFAIFKLERKIDGQSVRFDDVKDRLAQQVRRQNERIAMESLAREMLSSADVVVLDPGLKKSWDTQRQTVNRGP